MTREQIIIGKKVWYYPVIGWDEKYPATITSEPYDMCGTVCCKIDAKQGVIDIENLEERA